MTYWIINGLALIGGIFALIAAIGIVRFPDFYCRMHAATKAGAFGGSCLLLAAALTHGNPKSWVLAIATIVFFYITAPVAGHLLGRTALRNKVPVFKKPMPEQKSASK